MLTGREKGKGEKGPWALLPYASLEGKERKKKLIVLRRTKVSSHNSSAKGEKGSLPFSREKEGEIKGVPSGGGRTAIQPARRAARKEYGKRGKEGTTHYFYSSFGRKEGGNYPSQKGEKTSSR